MFENSSKRRKIDVGLKEGGHHEPPSVFRALKYQYFSQKSSFVDSIKSLYRQAMNSICSEVHASKRLSTPREVEERLEAVTSAEAFRVDLAGTDVLYGVLHFSNKRWGFIYKQFSAYNGHPTLYRMRGQHGRYQVSRSC